jgi:hypothetical protein
VKYLSWDAGGRDLRADLEHGQPSLAGHRVRSGVGGDPAGPKVGVVSGSALVVDYVLTITISVAAGAEAVFSFLPGWTLRAKLPVEFAALALLVVLNLRGVKE